MELEVERDHEREDHLNLTPCHLPSYKYTLTYKSISICAC